MQKNLISPKQPNAFREDVLRQVADDAVGYELPDDVWNAFDRAFAIYWDIEVGVGNIASADDMYNSIRKYLNKHNILLPDEHLYNIIDHLWDFMAEIPDAIQDL